jgi:sialic acid synthase SpsE
VQYGPTQAEQTSLRYRRSLYVVQDVAAGQPFTAQNVRAIRPGLGLPPKYMEVVLQHKAARDLKMGTAVAWDLLA